MSSARRWRSVWQPILIVVLFFGIVYYAILAANNHDALWWWPWFDEKPSEIVVCHAGERTVVTPDSPDYAPLVQAVNQSLSRRVGFLSLGLSEVTLREYEAEATVIELTYPELVSMHSQYRLVPFDGLLIPLEGRHSEWHVIFFSQYGQYIAGALQLATTDPMKDALADLGYW
jgi:hypothetical protein